MAERDETPSASPEARENPPRVAPAVPPKRLPLVLTILLLALLPAAAAGIWLGGRLHTVDDRPAVAKKPTRSPRHGGAMAHGASPGAADKTATPTRSASAMEGSTP